MSCTSKVCWVVGLQFCIIYSAKCRIYYSGVSVWYHLSGRDAEPEPEAEAPETESGSFFQIDPLMERGFGFLEGGEIQLSMNCPAPVSILGNSVSDSGICHLTCHDLITLLT